MYQDCALENFKGVTNVKVVDEKGNIVNNSKNSEPNKNEAETLQKETTNAVEDEKNKNEENDKLCVRKLDVDLVYDLMKVPTASKYEFRMCAYIMIWARKNNIKYETDDYGNIYLTKGELSDDEYYPCVTSHLDTVQTKQELFALAGAKLDVKTEITKEKQHKIFVEGFGIGGDDKAGLCICLNMFKFHDKLKACFFLEEELGDVGSSHLNKKWFEDVGYVIGFDSPDHNRAAYKCSGYDLMPPSLFKEYELDKLCAKYGVNDFRSEPITDVVEIRKQTDVVCMNFGTGYYLCHSDSEYCILEDMDDALCLGDEIISTIGLTCHRMKCGVSSYYMSDDDEYFEALNPKYKRVETYKSSGNTNYSNTNNNSSFHENNGYSSGYTAPNASTNSKEVNFEMVDYVVEVYETRLTTIESELREKCKALGINFDENFATIFNTPITF